jgi:diacylglycerol kinase (ATP)
MSGLLDAAGPRPRLAIVPAGTGNDVARHANIGSVADAVAALRAGQDRAFDVIEVSWTDGRGAHRGYAFLQAIVGFSGSVAVRPSVKRVFGATIAYYLGALTAMAAYQAPQMVISTDGLHYDGPMWMVIVGNAEWTSGASMRLSPGARTDDAELNVTVIPKERSKLRMAARMMPRIASGEHVRDPAVDYFSATGLDLRSSRPTTLDLDGELRQASSVHCHVRAGGLQMVTGPTPADRSPAHGTGRTV